MTILGGHLPSPLMPLSCGFAVLTILEVTFRDGWWRSVFIHSAYIVGTESWPARSDIHRLGIERGETDRMDDLEEWTPLHELAAFFEAAGPHEFHRMLVTLPPVPGNTGDTFLPWCLFHKFHEGQPEGAATTAMLLVTDRRWRTATGRLIGRIAESGLVPAEHLDLLAQTFLAAGRHVYWELPAEWFDGPGIVIEGADTEPDAPDEGSAAEESDRPVVAAREIRPPVRRWAAERLVRADPAMWGAMVARARELDSKNGPAVLRGVLDAIDTLPEPARKLILTLCADWPNHDVRKAARELSYPVTNPANPTRRDLALVTGTSRKPAMEEPTLF
jgi:hypothetical protein